MALYLPKLKISFVTISNSINSGHFVNLPTNTT